MVKKPCAFEEYMIGNCRPRRVRLVRVDLVHHLDHRIVVGDEQPRLPVGREIHVALWSALRKAEATASSPRCCM